MAVNGKEKTKILKKRNGSFKHSTETFLKRCYVKADTNQSELVPILFIKIMLSRDSFTSYYQAAIMLR